MAERLVNSEANNRRIGLVESCFGNTGQPLNIPGRVLVGEGVLTKACRKKPKPRQFFLFNDLLVYGNIIINKKKYNKQHIIPLEEVKLQSLEDDGQYRNGWLICTRGKSFAVYAATATEKQEWMAHIDKCVQDLLKKSGKKAAAEHAAVWVPDSEANTCMVCNKAFNLINRRHHCRKCGAVCCGACSMNKLLLPSQSSKPLRVCDKCYEEENKNQPSSGNGNEPPARPPPPQLFPESKNPKEEVSLPPLPEGEIEVEMPKRNPKLYELVNMTQEMSLWWDSVDAEEDELAEGISPSVLGSNAAAKISACFGESFDFDPDTKNSDSSDEDDSDNEEDNVPPKSENDSGQYNKIDSNSGGGGGGDIAWYDADPEGPELATLPAFAALSYNLSPLSQIGPLPRISREK